MRTTSLRRALTPLLALLALMVGLPAFAQQTAPMLTILFTGDNGGEVAPCG